MTMAFQHKACLVTGYGFVSPYLVRRLVELGADVTVVERNPLPFHRQEKSVKFVYTDIRYLHQRLAFDYVFHLAGITNAAYAEANPLETFEANILATCNLLARVDVKERFVFTSSAVVYGVPTGDASLSEDHSPQPISVYGASKIAAEEVIRAWARTRELPYSIARFFNLYGPRQSPIYVVPQICVQALKDREIVLRNAAAERDFLYVEDAIECLLALATTGVHDSIVNVGTGVAVSLREVVSIVLGILGDPNISLELGSQQDRFSPLRLVADITKARQLNWTPKTTLQVGLAKTLEYYQRVGPVEEILFANA